MGQASGVLAMSFSSCGADDYNYWKPDDTTKESDADFLRSIANVCHGMANDDPDDPCALRLKAIADMLDAWNVGRHAT